MHSPWARANAALTFFGSAAAVLCALTALTDFARAGDPRVDLKLTGVKRLAPHRGGHDQAVLGMSLDADLRPAFGWNTKQLFVFIRAEYQTDDNAVNEVVLWDRIVRSKDEAALSIPAVKHKYALLDRGSGLRGRELTLTLAWNHMPRVGALRHARRSFAAGRLPDEYTN